jgi:hypothetical protein
VATTRTIGPLHLEDLEPHRFEDLVRQLIYDFRNWRSLEATGRAGSDDGFDARAAEIIAETSERETTSEDDEERASAESAADRIWLVQCKREKTINPKKLIRYLDDIPEGERREIYGIIVAAACDFSKAARDAFRSKIREMGFAEAHLWGKGEMEDMLFQPKNDHLLFAYFGFSLLARRRTLASDIRARLAAKRKALRLLQDYSPTLIRDAADERYPFVDQDKSKPRVERGRWDVRRYHGCFHDGLHFILGRHFAFLGEDGAWDYAERVNDGRLTLHENPWSEKEDDGEDRSAAMTIWDQLPQQNRAWFEVLGVLPYEAVVDIDDKGDEFLQAPHVYVTLFDLHRGPFRYFLEKLEVADRWSGRRGEPLVERRTTIFPRQDNMEKR